jgi:phage FluMu gp28-like protein
MPALVSPLDMLFPYQRRFVDDASRFKVGVMSRQVGKSVTTSAEVAADSFIEPENKWVCMSAGERQALEWHSKANDWCECFGLQIADYAEERAYSEALMKKAETTLSNGSRIISIPANPSTARGYTCNVVLDEFDYHEDQDAIWRAIYPSITNPMGGSLLTRFQALKRGEKIGAKKFKMRVVSTYNGKRKCFELMNDPAWSHHLVTIHDAVAGGLPIDVEELRAGFRDPEGWQQEFECLPLDASNVLLPYDLIALAESAEATLFADVPDSSSAAPIFLGIDFGRQNDPTVCWMLQKVGDILWTREVLVLEKMDVPSQQEILRSRIRVATSVCFDYTGPGIGLGDFLAKEYGRLDPAAHKFGKIELATFTVAFKREIFPKLRRAFEAPTKLRIPIDRETREDLHAMRQVVGGGQYNYWAPRTREGHSDRCTALALAVRAAGDGAVQQGIL